MMATTPAVEDQFVGVVNAPQVQFAPQGQTDTYDYDSSHKPRQVIMFIRHNWQMDTAVTCRPPRNGAFRRYVREARKDGKSAAVERALSDIKAEIQEVRKERERQEFLTP